MLDRVHKIDISDAGIDPAVLEEYRLNYSKQFIANVLEEWGERKPPHTPWQNHAVSLPARETLSNLWGMKEKTLRECAQFLEICHRLKIDVEPGIRPYICIVIARKLTASVEALEDHIDDLREEYAMAANPGDNPRLARKFITDMRRAWAMIGEPLNDIKWQKHQITLPNESALRQENTSRKNYPRLRPANGDLLPAGHSCE